MNFKHFFCNNCEIEKEDDGHLFFDKKNIKEIFKNNNNDINVKSIISTSDNNNSINYNLEIIEYPYSFISKEYSPIPHPPTSKINLEKKNKLLKYDNYINKVSPLFIEENKENNLNEGMIINNENNNTNRRETPNSSLINNEDSIMNHKAFIDSYNTKGNINKTTNEVAIKNIINHNQKRNKINEIKIDYPCPDIDFFLQNKTEINSNLNFNFNKTNNIKQNKTLNGIKISTIKQNKTLNGIKNNTIKQNKSLNGIKNKTKQKSNDKKNSKGKIKTSFKNINLNKIKINQYKNISNILAYESIMKNKKKKINNEKPIKVKKTQKDDIEKKLIFVKLNNRAIKKKNLKIQTIKEKDKNLSTKLNFSMKSLSNKNTSYNKYISLKTENYSQHCTRKIKSKYLPSSDINDSIRTKINLKSRNTVSNFKNKKKNENTKVNVNISQINVNKYLKQKKNYLSNTYTNPFNTLYKKSKNFKLYLE